jgi:hypothetical protein
MNVTKLEIAEALRINRTLDRLTKAARNAYSVYSRAKGRRTGRIQSMAEMKARDTWSTQQSELSTFCYENKIRAPKTW